MAVKNSQRFAEIERLMGDYFGCHLAPVMGRVQRDLSNRQADEMRAYSNSTAGILRSLATANMPGDDPYATLKITGKWNSKTTEDYLAMCKEAIVGNKDMQRDLAVMAEEWRKAVVTEIGRERYDALSKQLGCDLAYAYIDHRMEQLMIEKMVKDRMPTSSADYIIRKAAQSSLFGLPYELNKSPLAAEIEALSNREGSGMGSRSGCRCRGHGRDWLMGNLRQVCRYRYGDECRHGAPKQER